MKDYWTKNCKKKVTIMEEKDNEEYKKRVKELIDKMENEKDDDKDTAIGEAQVLEAQKRLLQTAKSKIHPDFRDVKIVLVFVYTIRDYYRRRAESSEKDQFQEEIDALYKLIYEELKKPNPFFLNYNSNRTNYAEISDKRRVLGHIAMVLGKEKMTQFYQKFNIGKLLQVNRSGRNMTTSQYNWMLFVVIAAIAFTVIIFALRLI
ncbi:unnamed protein product [marine sediment metagenome]|uniref:Uncharacterized protein n=2 Tax=marine sediment metagenome TaxID=412755 RepID=X1QUU8_9ZZZZ